VIVVSSNLLKIDDLIVLGEPGLVRLKQSWACASERGAEPFGSAIFQLRAANQATGLQNDGVPIRFERKFELDTDNAIIVVFRAASDAISAIERQWIDGLRYRRAFETKILRNWRRAASGRFRSTGLTERTQMIEMNSFRHLVEIENPETTA